MEDAAAAAAAVARCCCCCRMEEEMDRTRVRLLRAFVAEAPREGLREGCLLTVMVALGVVPGEAWLPSLSESEKSWRESSLSCAWRPKGYCLFEGREGGREGSGVRRDDGLLLLAPKCV